MSLGNVGLMLTVGSCVGYGHLARRLKVLFMRAAMLDVLISSLLELRC